MNLAFRKYGSGKPLLILHGLFGQSDNWNTLAKKFSEHSFEVYAIDLRNHGLSPHSEVFNYEVMADDIGEFIEEHKLRSPVLLGHSMGGKVAMYFAMENKHMLDKLIVADMSPRQYPPHHSEVLEALHAVDFSSITTRKEAEEILSKYIPDFGTKQFLLKNIFWEDTGANKMNWRFDLQSITKNYEAILAAVPEGESSLETLFIRGDRSDYIKEIDIVEIGRRFLNYKLQTIQNSGHWVHAEQPEKFFEAVLRFIK